VFLAYFLSFEKIRVGSRDHFAARVSVFACVSPIKFRIRQPVFMKTGMYIMAPEPILTATSQIPPISLCVCMCIPPVVDRQQLGK
jgi:hypothetical protein